VPTGKLSLLGPGFNENATPHWAFYNLPHPPWIDFPALDLPWSRAIILASLVSPHDPEIPCQSPTSVRKGDPERILLWSEVHTGLTLDAYGEVRVLSAAAWHQRRADLEEPGGPPLPD
jgi:hypothetical protein